MNRLKWALGCGLFLSACGIELNDNECVNDSDCQRIAPGTVCSQESWCVRPSAPIVEEDANRPQPDASGAGGGAGGAGGAADVGGGGAGGEPADSGAGGAGGAPVDAGADGAGGSEDDANIPGDTGAADAAAADATADAAAPIADGGPAPDAG